MMRNKAKMFACCAAAVLVSGCTVEEMQSFALGATVALVAASAAQADTYQDAYGPTSCDYGYTLELGYDEYDNPVRFCAQSSPYMSQEELNALAATAN